MGYRILVATDFTEASTHAVRYAMTILARIPGSVLHVGHVIVESGKANLAKDDRLLGDALERLRTSIDALAKGAAADGEKVERDVVHHVRIGKSAARAIEQIALDVDADLVVVGTHARKGLDRLVLGSVAEDLLRSGRVALLVARPNTFDGMERTAKPEAAKPGVNVHAERYDLVESSARITWTARPSHIAGLL
jgi:nucleotide-binding universal stress UspA family protein